MAAQVVTQRQLAQAGFFDLEPAAEAAADASIVARNALPRKRVRSLALLRRGESAPGLPLSAE
jgi:hypothetical protein